MYAIETYVRRFHFREMVIQCMLRGLLLWNAFEESGNSMTTHYRHDHQRYNMSDALFRDAHDP